MISLRWHLLTLAVITALEHHDKLQKYFSLKKTVFNYNLQWQLVSDPSMIISLNMRDLLKRISFLRKFILLCTLFQLKAVSLSNLSKNS